MPRRKVTYRPSKASGVFGIVWGGLFVLIGLFVVIPTFGPFGIIWTLAALAITGMNAYHTFGNKYVGPEIHIEEEESSQYEGGSSIEQRLQELRNLYDRSLITEEEYEAKKQEILEEL